MSLAFGDQTYKYRIRIALTLIYSCIHGQIYSCYFLQAKLGHHKVKDVMMGFELNIYCLIVHCLIVSAVEEVMLRVFNTTTAT